MDEVRSQTRTNSPATAPVAAEAGTRQRAGTAPEPKPLPSVLAAAGILGPIVFTVGFGVQDLSRRGYDPIAQQVSELTAGRYGWVQQVNFVVFGLLMIAFAEGLRRVRAGGDGAVVPAIVAWNGAELVVAGIFPLREDATGRVYDPVGVHSLNGKVFFLSIGVGLVVASRRFARDARWRGLAAYALATGVTLPVMFMVAGVLAVPEGAPLHPWSGVVQRAILAVWFPCLVILALRLRRVARPGVADVHLAGWASPASRDAGASASDWDETTGAPRWVRAFVVIGALVLILLFAVEHAVFERLPGGGMSHTGKGMVP